MTIKLIDNTGDGWVKECIVENNSTILELFRTVLGHTNTKDYSIRVNRKPVKAEYILQDNDIVSILPTKIGGAY